LRLSVCTGEMCLLCNPKPGAGPCMVSFRVREIADKGISLTKHLKYSRYRKVRNQ
jgi:hypothetical protein